MPTRYTLVVDQKQVDVILRGLFCLAKVLPTQLDSAAPGTDREQSLLTVQQQAETLLGLLIELPQVEAHRPGTAHELCL
jgi:hypothetical protein